MTQLQSDPILEAVRRKRAAAQSDPILESIKRKRFASQEAAKRVNIPRPNAPAPEPYTPSQEPLIRHALERGGIAVGNPPQGAVLGGPTYEQMQETKAGATQSIGELASSAVAGFKKTIASALPSVPGSGVLGEFKESQQFEPAPTGAGGAIGSAGANVAMALPAMIPGAQGPVLAAFAGSAAQQSLESTAKRKDLNAAQRAGAALGQGISEAGTEMIGLGALGKAFRTIISGRGGAAQAARALVDAGVTNVAEEELNLAAQNASDVVFGVKTPDQALADVMAQAPTVARDAGLMTLMFGGLSAAARTAKAPFNGRQMLTRPESVSEYVAQNPQGAARLAAREKPTRSDFRAAGVEGEFQASQRQQIAEAVRQEIGNRAVSSEQETSPDQSSSVANLPTSQQTAQTALDRDESGASVSESQAVSSVEEDSTNPLAGPQGGIQPETAAALLPSTAPPAVSQDDAIQSAMGAAAAPELARGPSSVKNAYTEQRREQLGLPERDKPTPVTFDALDTKAKQTLEQNPSAGYALVEHVLGGEDGSTVTALSDEQNAVLGLHIATLDNELDRLSEASTRADQEGDTETFTNLQNRMAIASDELTYAMMAAERTGTLQGRALGSRRMAWNTDLSLAKMTSLARANRGGRQLTPEESETIRKLHEQIADLQKQLALKEAAAEQANIDTATDEQLKRTQKQERRGGQETALGTETVEDVLAEQGQMPDDFATLVKRLTRAYVRAGMEGRDNVMQAVHKAVLPQYPGATLRDVKVGFTDYGDFKNIKDKSPEAELLRQYRGELQQVLKIEDMSQGRAPLATGTERPTPGDVWRKLTKVVNEMKRRGGFKVTDPAKQLKTALDAVKTRLSNQIKDLSDQIRTREKIIKKKTELQYDEEATALRKRRDELKQEYDAIFGTKGLTDEQRLKMATRAAERSLAEYERRITELDFSAQRGKPLSTPELEAIRAKRDAAKAIYEELRSLDPASSIAASERAIERSIEELEATIRAGDPKEAGPSQSAWSEKIADLKKKQAELRATLAAIRENRQLTPEQQIQAAENALASQIKNFDKPPQAKSSSLWSLRIADMQAQLRTMRQSPEHLAIVEQRKLAALKRHLAKRIEKLTERMAKKDYSKKPVKPKSPLDAEAEALQNQVNELHKQFRNDLLDARAIEADKAEIARMKGELAAGTVPLPPPKRESREKSPEARRSRLERLRVKEAYDLAQKAKMPKSWVRHFFDALGIYRAAITTGEFSVVARQGGAFLFGHPLQAYGTIKLALKAMANPTYAKNLENELLNHPNALDRFEAGIKLVHSEEALLASEEVVVSRWVDKIPGIKQFNRFSRTYLNLMRAQLYDILEASAGRDLTTEEKKALGSAVNVGTGRGPMGDLEGAMTAVNQLLFSARFVASRFQYETGYGVLYGKGATARTRIAVAKEYGRTLMGVAAFYALASLAGGEWDRDPRSSNFMKIKIGNTWIDPLFGLAQISTFLFRTALGEKKTQSGRVVDLRDAKYRQDDGWDVTKDFLRSKLAPVPSKIGNIVLSGTNYLGEPATPWSEFGPQTLVPITWNDVVNVWKAEGIPEATAISVLAFLGFGVRAKADESAKPMTQAEWREKYLK